MNPGVLRTLFVLRADNRTVELSATAHAHDFHQIVYMVQGACLVVADGLEYRVGAGHLLVIGPSQIHSMTFPDAAVQLCDTFQLKFRMNPEAGLRLPAGLVDCSAHQRQVEAAIALIEHAVRHVQQPEADAAVGGLLTYLSALVSRTPDGAGRIHDPRIRTAIEHILANLDAPIRVAHLAQLAGLDPSYFCRLFHACLGVSPQAWIIARRMERARDLLLFTSATSAEVAEAVACCNHQHFSSQFLKAHGLRPSAYRARLRRPASA